jgi:hypothetical protein
LRTEESRDGSVSGAGLTHRRDLREDSGGLADAGEISSLASGSWDSCDETAQLHSQSVWFVGKLQVELLRETYGTGRDGRQILRIGGGCGNGEGDEVTHLAGLRSED